MGALRPYPRGEQETRKENGQQRKKQGHERQKRTKIKSNTQSGGDATIETNRRERKYQGGVGLAASFVLRQRW